MITENTFIERADDMSITATELKKKDYAKSSVAVYEPTSFLRLLEAEKETE